MKHRLPFFNIFLSLFFFATIAVCFQANAQTQTLNGLAAIVNDQVITQAELNVAFQSAKQQLVASQNPNAIDDAKLRQMVLQQLIDQKLQLEIAERAKVEVSNAEVNTAIAHIAAQNHISIAQLQEALLKEGMKFKTYHEMIHEQLLAHKVAQSAVANQIHITDADLQAARNDWHTHFNGQKSYHVVDIRADTQEKAQQIAAALKSGKKPEEIAPNNATDMGWQTTNSLPSLFLAQISKMQPGDIAGPIQAPNGFHVLQLLEVRGQSSEPTKQQLQNIAFQMQTQKAVQKWMKDVRKTAYIKIISP